MGRAWPSCEGSGDSGGSSGLLARQRRPARDVGALQADPLGDPTQPDELGEDDAADTDAGGSFEGPRLRGKVLAGGADRQLLRKDGARLLDALYEMQTDDGAIITVHNQVLTRPDGPGRDYRFSHVTLTAPEGKYAWLNQSVHVGTLHSLRPRPAVLIRVYRLY